MKNLRIRISLFLNYFVFAILLNSVGTVILQVQNNFGVSQSAASVLEAFKDLSIAAVSFFVASFIVRIGYKNSMLIALGFITAVALLMPSIPGFWSVKLLFAATGTCFALIKVSVFATLGIITKNSKDHASLMNFLESFFMIGVLSGSLIFSAFVKENEPASTSWFSVYYVLGGLSCIAFILLLTTPLDESSVRGSNAGTSNKISNPTPIANAENDFGEMIKLIASGLVIVFVISAFFYVMIEQSIMSWLPTFNSQVLHLSNKLSIQIPVILAASIAIGRFLAGFLLRKIHWLAVLVTCLIMAAILVLLAIPLAQHIDPRIQITSLAHAPAVAFIFPLIGLLLAPIYPAINSVILSALPKRKHASMSGLIVVFSALGGTIGSIITGFIFKNYGGKQAFYFSLAPITILIIALFMLNKLQKKSATKIEFSPAATH
ncbi:MAG: MFS transporter [Chitinophagaceae bacterium]